MAAAVAHEIEINLQCRWAVAQAGQPFDSLRRFAGSLRFVAGEVVETAAGMRVNDRERRFFFLQIFEDLDQREVLDHIGEIPGVKGVAIVHAPMMNKSANHAILI